MISGAVNRGAMPCESCSVQFSVFKRKRVCSECERCFCSGCLRRGGGAMCPPCRLLSTRPLAAHAIAHLKARDLQCFLQRQNVSTRGCVEKDELVNLCVSHVNSAGYRRRGAGGGGGAGGARPSPAFTLKGFTNNINEFISSTFDLRPGPASQPRHPAPAAHSQPRGCCNATHVHIVIPNTQPCSHTGHRQPAPAPERFTVTPGGERDVRVPVEGVGAGGVTGTVSRSASRDSTHVESADCFEIEDLDDTGWEFVTRPADPLPNDSEVLMCPTDGAPQPAPQPRARLIREHLNPEMSPGPPARASSELELRSGASDTGDTASLQDVPVLDVEPQETTLPGGAKAEHVTLGGIPDAAALETLTVRQLKELLTRNRVEFRGCIERADLLLRARMLYREHAQYKDELDNLPIEECCKICMAAPLECVLLECGHIAACTACSKQLAECPICRQYVVRAVRFFRS